MRSYGKIECAFWQNRKMKQLSNNEKLFMLYLFSCPHGNSIGSFILPAGYIATDLGWPEETVTQTLSQTVSKGLIEYDYDFSIVRIPSWFEHNTLENPNVVKEAIRFLDALPECQIKVSCFNDIYEVPRDFIKPLLEPFRNRYPNGMPNPEPTPEPEPKPINTPPPPKPVDKSAPVDNSGKDGVLKNGIFLGGGVGDIISILSDRGLQAAKDAAPGWDIYHLASVYNAGVAERGGLPKYPDKAFPEWCIRYTKGKQP